MWLYKITITNLTNNRFPNRCYYLCKRIKCAGKIRDVTILDAGAHYTDATFPRSDDYKVTINAYTNFLCTDISDGFTLNETVTGGTSGATGVYKATNAARNIIKLNTIIGTFLAGPDKSGETITGSNSGTTAILDSYEIPSLKADDGVLGETSGRFLNEDGFIDEKTKKIQDSYYYQDFSYVIKTSNSINTWRDQLLAVCTPCRLGCIWTSRYCNSLYKQ